MRVLFIDTDRDRQREMALRLPANQLVCCYDDHWPVAHLRKGEIHYDVICLDHGVAGYKVAQLLTELPTKHLPSCVVAHSTTTDGVTRILTVLEPLHSKGVDVVAVPFGMAEFWAAVEGESR